MRPSDELNLVRLLRKEYIPDLTSAEKSNSFYDAISFQVNAIVELKCRRSHYDNLMLEKIRYERLLTIATREDMGCLYIVSSPKGVWSFDLIGIPEPTWKTKSLPSKTAWTKNRKMIDKEVGYLSVDDGTNITHLL
jgi:hypothetical protein